MGFTLPALRPRQPLVGIAVAAALGVAGADAWEVSPRVALAITLLLAAPLFTHWRNTGTCWAFAGACFFTLHTARHYGSEARELADGFANGRTVVTAHGLVWSEPEKPKTWSPRTTGHFVLKLETLERNGVRTDARALMNAHWAGPLPAYGDRVSLRASASNLPPPTNPGQFDFATYEQRQGIYSELRAGAASDCRVESSGHGDPLQLLSSRISAGIRHSLEVDLEDSPEISALIESMVLGVHGDSLDQIKAPFQLTGTMHLFAVSGLNVAILAVIGFHLLKPFGVSRRLAFFLLAPTLALYAAVTGFGASSVRACIMGALLLGSAVVDRPALAWNSLGAAVLLILAWDTEQLFSPGFQFSFALVVVLLGFASRLQARIEPLGMPDPFLPRLLWGWREKTRAYVWRYAAGNCCVSLTAWFGSLFFTARYFHLFAPSTVVANLIAVPLSFIITGLAIASILTGWCCAPLAALFNNANWSCAHLLLWVVGFFAQVPGGHTYVAMPDFATQPACEITVLDVGTGGAAFIRTRKADWLIDCGHGYEYERVVLPFLRSRGVSRLDGLLLTHGDVQHIGGASAALGDLHPGVLVDSPLKDRSTSRRKLFADLAAAGVPKSICQRGDVLHLDAETELRVLFPPAGLACSVADDKAFVLMLENSGVRTLLTSDSGFPTEQWLLAHEPDLRADVLVKGWHAKDLSGTSDFLAAVKPKTIIATRPEYGASRETMAEWKEMVAQRGITLFAQDEAGAATIELRDGQFSVRAFCNGQTFRSRAR